MLCGWLPVEPDFHAPSVGPVTSSVKGTSTIHRRSNSGLLWAFRRATGPAAWRRRSQVLIVKELVYRERVPSGIILHKSFFGKD